jgi:outer membrane protein assembly factor BamB
VVVKTSTGWLTNEGADLLLLDANGSPTTIATLPDIPVWAAAATDADGTVYLWLKNNTLISLAAAPKSLPRSLDYSGPEAPTTGAMWGGRLYVLSQDGTQIWKLPPTLTGFGRGSAWLAAPVANAFGLAIDGSIYSAIANDAVRRFEKGKMSPFAAAGATANAAPVTINITANNIYLLGGDATIAAWDKEGKLAAQYALPGNEGKITAFAVDETAKKIIYTTDKGVVSQFTLTK